MVTKIIDNWYSKVKKILFKYRDGFFELPIVTNTPEATIKSVVKMPFVYHNKKNNSFGTDNPFIKADVLYQEIEENALWTICSKALYKENVNYVNQKSTDISSDYYMLFFEINSNKSLTKNTLLNGVRYSSSSWIITKPLVTDSQCCFKGRESYSVGIYFTKNWLEKESSILNQGQVKALKKFMDATSKMAIWSEKEEVERNIKSKLELCFSKNNITPLNKADWKELILHLFELFLERCFVESSQKNLFELSHTDRKKIQKVEKRLLDSLQDGFVGIDILAKEIGMSPTKLKIIFKAVYGDSIFQYYRKSQLKAAQVIFKNNKTSVKDVAALFGYENSSKFSSAYKDLFGISPSLEMK